MISESEIDIFIDEIESLLKPSQRLLAAFNHIVTIPINDLDTIKIKRLHLHVIPLLENTIVQQENLRNPFIYCQINETFQLSYQEYLHIIKILFSMKQIINPLARYDNNIIYSTRQLQKIINHTHNVELNIWWADFIELISVLQSKNSILIHHLTQYFPHNHIRY